MWSKNIVSGKTWGSALNYCEKLIYAGYDNWRLPTINELKTLVDHSIYDPASEFPGISSDYFFSSTSYESDYTNAWIIWLEDGRVHGALKTEEYSAICVR